MLSGSGRCFYHPDRAGLGICVECRNVICVECTTQFEGINRCAKCLAARLAKAKKLVARKDWSAGNVLLSLFSLGAVFGIVWLLTRAFT
ncbi:MAG: hypothetical protein QM723_13470 [Myxococcaceae bacterium]